MFLVMSLLMNLKYSLIKVCDQYLVQKVKDQGVVIVVTVREDKGEQGSGGKD